MTFFTKCIARCRDLANIYYDAGYTEVEAVWYPLWYIWFCKFYANSRYYNDG